MTPLAPIRGSSVVPLERDHFVLDEWPAAPARALRCCCPVCPEPSHHRHHIFSRSKLAGPHDFVVIDFTIITNVVDLCDRHHDRLEEHSSRLIYFERNGYGWYDRADHTTDTSKAAIWKVFDDVGGAWMFKGFLRGEPSEWIKGNLLQK